VLIRVWVCVTTFPSEPVDSTTLRLVLSTALLVVVVVLLVGREVVVVLEDGGAEEGGRLDALERSEVGGRLDALPGSEDEGGGGGGGGALEAGGAELEGEVAESEGDPELAIQEIQHCLFRCQNTHVWLAAVALVSPSSRTQQKETYTL
jgi:hypothetical protein